MASMTHAISKRRGQGEDSIYWDESKSRYDGAVSLGFSPAGTCIRKRVTGRTKTEVRDKLRDLHKQVEGGLRPRRRYTVGDALDAWLAVGLDGLSVRTVTLYRDTIAKPRGTDRYAAPPRRTSTGRRGHRSPSPPAGRSDGTAHRTGIVAARHNNRLWTAATAASPRSRAAPNECGSVCFSHMEG